jgi:rubredoxin
VPSQVVQLACTACQLVYEPDFAAFDTGTTGCPRCGGWTWIAQLGASLLTATCGSALSVVREGDFR